MINEKNIMNFSMISGQKKKQIRKFGMVIFGI